VYNTPEIPSKGKVDTIMRLKSHPVEIAFLPPATKLAAIKTKQPTLYPKAYLKIRKLLSISYKDFLFLNKFEFLHLSIFLK